MGVREHQRPRYLLLEHVNKGVRIAGLDESNDLRL